MGYRALGNERRRRWGAGLPPGAPQRTEECIWPDLVLRSWTGVLRITACWPPVVAVLVAGPFGVSLLPLHPNRPHGGLRDSALRQPASPSAPLYVQRPGGPAELPSSMCGCAHGAFAFPLSPHNSTCASSWCRSWREGVPGDLCLETSNLHPVPNCACQWLSTHFLCPCVLAPQACCHHLLPYF